MRHSLGGENLGLKYTVNAMGLIINTYRITGVPIETENRGIHENFLYVKVYTLFYSPLQNVGTQNLFLKEPS